MTADRADVVVVGGGLVGTAAALTAVEAGASVVLVDRADPGRATDAGAGILSPETVVSTDARWIALFRAAGAYHEQLADRFDTSWARCGLLILAMRPSDLPAFAEMASVVTGNHPSVVEVDGDDARARFPVLAPVLRARWNPAAARLDGRRCRATLLAAAEVRGASVRVGSVQELARSGDRIDGVVLADGSRIGCGALVVAGGAWSDELEAQLGVTLGIRPARGQIIHLRTGSTETAAWPIASPVLGHYLVPWPDGRVAVGATYEDAAGFDPRPTADGVAEVLREALRVAPGLGDATLGEIRVGLRPASPDDKPVLGPVPGWSNVVACTGHGAEGLLLGPYTAHLVVQHALGSEPDTDLAPFAPHRFV